MTNATRYAIIFRRLARAEAWATPLASLDVAIGERFRTDTHWACFERARRKIPQSYFGADPIRGRPDVCPEGQPSI